MHINGERKFSGMLRDLTGRVNLEGALGASEARWRAIVDSAVDGIVVIDTYGRVEAFNRGAERLFGYKSAEVLGRNVDMLMPSPYREEHDTYLGLPTVKRFVEAHDGEITVECPAAGGTTVLIRLPVTGTAIGQPAAV